MSDEIQPQPILPRVGMVWFFIVASVVAVALGIIRAAEQGRALQAALVFSGLFIALFGLFAVISFLIAFFIGAVERAVVGKIDTPASPFSDGSLPPQIVPPKPVDGNA